MPTPYVPLQGSYLPPLEGSKLLRRVPPLERISVTLTLRRRAPLPEPASGANPVSRKDFETKYGMSREDASEVEKFAMAFGLTIESSDVSSRRIVLSGTSRQLSKAFRVPLVLYDDGKGRIYRTCAGVMHIPMILEKIITGVFGFDDRQQASPVGNVTRTAT